MITAGYGCLQRAGVRLYGGPLLNALNAPTQVKAECTPEGTKVCVVEGRASVFNLSSVVMIKAINYFCSSMFLLHIWQVILFWTWGGGLMDVLDSRAEMQFLGIFNRDTKVYDGYFLLFTTAYY